MLIFRQSKKFALMNSVKPYKIRHENSVKITRVVYQIVPVKLAKIAKKQTP